MPLIVESYRKQTVPVEIWMINNNGLEDFGADRLIAAPWNPGEMHRYLWLNRVETEYVCFQDDDFLIGDDKFLEDALKIYEEKCPDALLGVAGRNIHRRPKYYRKDATPDRRSNMLKGHFQLFRKSVVKNMRFPSHNFRADIQFSLDLTPTYGEGVPWYQGLHWVSKDLKDRLVRLDTHGEGLEFRPEHWEEAEQVCRDYLIERGFVNA